MLSVGHETSNKMEEMVINKKIKEKKMCDKKRA